MPMCTPTPTAALTPPRAKEPSAQLPVQVPSNINHSDHASPMIGMAHHRPAMSPARAAVGIMGSVSQGCHSSTVMRNGSEPDPGGDLVLGDGPDSDAEADCHENDQQPAGRFPPAHGRPFNAS